MPGDVALAGDLTLDLDTLAVRLVRVAAPFADEFAARRASAKLERALYERVASFTTAFARGPGAGARGPQRVPPRHTLVLPAAADVLAVVTDRPHAQIVGLFLRADAPEPFEVFDPADTEEARDVLKAVLPGALARAAAERLTERRRWAMFGDARGVRTFVRVPDGNDPASFFPTGTPGDARRKEKVAAAVELAASPTVFWRDDDDENDDDANDDDANDDDAARTIGENDDANAVAAVETRGGRTKPENEKARAMTHAFVFSSVRVFATRLARAAAPVVAAADDDDDADAASFATAAPLLHREALVVSLSDEPPPAYGHDSFDAFLKAFAAEYGVSLAALTRASDEYAASAMGDGENARTRVAELRFRGDKEMKRKRLWPSCLLLARHGATEIPARTARGHLASSLLSELVEDLNDDDARVPAPFGATLRLRARFGADATGDGARDARAGSLATDGDGVGFLRHASASNRRVPETVLIPAADLRRLNESTCARVEAGPPEAAETGDADDARLASLPAAPAPAAPRPPPRRLDIPSAFAGNAPKGRTGTPRGDAPRVAASPVSAAEAAEDMPQEEPSGNAGAEKENRAGSLPRKKPRFASFKTAATPKPTPKPKPSFKTTADPSSPPSPPPAAPPPPPSPPFPPLAAAAAAAEVERARQAEILAFLEAPVGHGAAALPPDAARAELEESFEAVLGGAEAEPNRDPAEATSVEATTSPPPREAAARDEREARAAADAEAMPPPPPRLPAVAASAPAAKPPSAPPPPPAPRPPKKKRAPAFSAFGFFSRAVRPTLARGLSLAEQTRALGEKWRLAEQSAKDAFAEEARRAKEAYLASSNPSSSEADERVLSAPGSEKEKKKRKAPPPADPEAAEAFLRERFAADGGDVGAFSAFLKGKNVSSDKLGAFLKKHDVPNVKRMKKEERVEKTVATLTRVLAAEDEKADA